jgi:DNA-binding LacI/PurR family transcriptional regulator
MLPSDGAGEGVSEEMDLMQIKDFIIKNPSTTAFFAIEYSIGLLVYKTLQELGLDNEKKVVFFDGIDGIYDSNPIFTRIKQGEYQIGTNSVDLVAQKINGQTADETRLIPYEIIEGNDKK